MRPPVNGTVARGFLREDAAMYLGRNEDGSFVRDNPVPVSLELMERGRNRYDIFCSPCHGYAGDGKGIISTGDYGAVPSPTYHDDRLRGVEDGYLFEVITNGIRTMQGYGYQIDPADRWAIVAYVRALQRSQNAGAEDVPGDAMR
jgi:mono/diheme cytochrome c family protein